MTIFQIGPNRWSTRPPRGPSPARSNLPLPYVISDTMDPVEQVDGKIYTSKSKFRAVGRALGLVEVGNDPARFRKKRRATDQHSTKQQRRRTLERALAQWKAGRRPRRA